MLAWSLLWKNSGNGKREKKKKWLDANRPSHGRCLPCGKSGITACTIDSADEYAERDRNSRLGDVLGGHGLGSCGYPVACRQENPRRCHLAGVDRALVELVVYAPIAV